LQDRLHPIPVAGPVELSMDKWGLAVRARLDASLAVEPGDPPAPSIAGLALVVVSALDAEPEPEPNDLAGVCVVLGVRPW
jgi:hypothetical protein